MASRSNRKVQSFVARSPDPLSHAVDALVIPWQFSMAYIFPPLALLPKVVNKKKRERTQIILVAPYWPRSWFADIVALARDEPFRLPQRDDLLTQGTVAHPNSHQ